ncbi:hypothetical protein SDRG_06201 [Saprolegnia diclina VS20]|uniref:Peptidase M14 domain-containing protein n=1 Tax=Saprolegnia diclina (strain VS20) TaxID=1156394 RepID=T0S0E1_SAPDV|nr:hypothetical protein SDRG_06201 [Saprolegnia diclina VS20]EQC36082.1 hypothetical protein SDRG_06201 [Saprolegnia diclina VS20]|eukprot:XP_008610188.1 hypothetical protein SDRG_06201 [Saprolegnia diclina VS20]
MHVALRFLMCLMALSVAAYEPPPLDDAIAADACSNATVGYLASLQVGSFSRSAYFDCFRRHDDVFAFMSAMLARVPHLTSANVTIGKTLQGRDIPAYTFSLSPSPPKQLVYIQALQHAREWIATTSTVYALARLLDDVVAQNKTVLSLLEAYEWCIVPIVNVDGYVATWNGDRYHRKNMRPFTVPNASSLAFGVDLNRNFGPTSSFKAETEEDTEVYPGTAPYSEPETLAIHTWLQAREPKSIVGALDVHTYGGWVLSPFGHQEDEPSPPYGNALATLANATRRAMGPMYLNQRSVQLYPVYGGFGDYMYLLYGAPALIIEMDGHDFRAPSSMIRPRGDELYAGVLTYVQALATWVNDAKPTPAPPNSSVGQTTSHATSWHRPSWPLVGFTLAAVGWGPNRLVL